jgi:hypothetical protein
LRQRHGLIVKGKRISCPPHYAPPNNDYDPPHHDYEHGFPLIRSLRASIQRSTSVLFSFVFSLLIVVESFAIRQSKTILARSLGAGRSRTVSPDDDLRRKFRDVEGSDREVSNELFSRDFGDEQEIHSTPTSSREHANTVGDCFRQRVRSSWFGDLLRWRARTSCHTDSGCDRNACANSQPVSNFCAGPHPSAPVR